VKLNWDFGDGTGSSESNPGKTFNNAGYYKVCLTATDSNDCATTVCKTIAVNIAEGVDVPSAFSPNGDGVNDVLLVRGYHVRSLRFVVYNRWGQKVFETTDMNTGWNGTFKGKPQEADVYGYTLDAVLESNKTIHKQGNISLLK
jgi:gliding motility-associated-like protein